MNVRNPVLLSVTTAGDCVFRLLEQIRNFLPEVPVLLISNGCNEEQNRRLSAVLPLKGKLLCLPENRGGSGGFAAGMDRFLSGYSGFGRLWLVDDDAVINMETLANLSRCADELEMKNIRWAACGSAIEAMETPGTLTECGAFVRRLSGRFGSKYAGKSFPAPEERPFDSEYCAATSLLISRQALETVGVFNEHIFLHFDDVDWCFRCRKAGFRIFAVPASVVQHPSRISKPASAVRYYDAANVIWFYRNHFQWLLLFVLFGQMSRAAYFYLHGFRKTAKLYCWGIRDGLKSDKRRAPQMLECEDYLPMSSHFLDHRTLYVLLSEKHLEKCRRLCCGTNSDFQLLPAGKVRRIMKNLWIIFKVRFSRYEQIVIDDEFKSRFILPFFWGRILYFDIERNQFRKSEE